MSCSDCYLDGRRLQDYQKFKTQLSRFRKLTEEEKRLQQSKESPERRNDGGSGGTRRRRRNREREKSGLSSEIERETGIELGSQNKGLNLPWSWITSLSEPRFQTGIHGARHCPNSIWGKSLRYWVIGGY